MVPIVTRTAAKDTNPPHTKLRTTSRRRLSLRALSIATFGYLSAKLSAAGAGGVFVACKYRARFCAPVPQVTEQVPSSSQEPHTQKTGSWQRRGQLVVSSVASSGHGVPPASGIDCIALTRFRCPPHLSHAPQDIHCPQTHGFGPAGMGHGFISHCFSSAKAPVHISPPFSASISTSRWR